MIIFKEKGNFKEGAIISIHKELGWTSFDVVNKIRIILKEKFNTKIKIGHAGTLDPLATGLLLLCTGKWTKRLSNFQLLEKEYITNFKLGETTSSFDLETEINQTYPIKHITLNLIEKSLQKFIGKISQIPPLFSAVKINGQRAHKLVRLGKKIILKPKTVNISSIDILSYDESSQLLKIKIICSKGTFVRALARDFGKEIQSGAFVYNLMRTRIGKYHLQDAYEIKKFIKMIENFN